MRPGQAKLSVAVVAFLVGAGFLPGAPVMATAAPTRYVGELLVQTKAGMSKENLRSTLKRYGAGELDEIGPIRVKRIKVPARSHRSVKAALARNRAFTFVEDNFVATALVDPNDTYYPSQWHLPKIAAPQAWEVGTGAAGVAIAVADTGVDPAHPDLAGKLLPGYNFYDNNTDAADVYGHGTKVAGSAAALSNNGAGVAGVSWNSPIMPLRISDASGYASYYNMARAITYAADNGVRVINLSYGGTSASSTLQSAVDYAWSKGAIVIASAGNAGSTTPNYPAACDKALAVSATTSTDVMASFSSYGTWIDLAAPGSGIYTTVRGGGYGSVSGTSFSAPITAGVAALVLSANPSLSNAQVAEILKANADDLGAAGFDTSFGHGRVNAERSVLAALQAPTWSDLTPPTAALTSPAGGSTVSGRVTVQSSASDDAGVVQVELYVDGQPSASTASAPYTFLWDTTALADGAHTLETVARDAAGNEGWSARVSVSVRNAPDTTPPTVAITAPASGSKVGRKVTVTARAYDDVGVVRTELSIDGVLKASAGSGNLSFSWNTSKVAAGAHTLTTRAFDAAGLSGSASVTVYK